MSRGPHLPNYKNSVTNDHPYVVYSVPLLGRMHEVTPVAAMINKKKVQCIPIGRKSGPAFPLLRKREREEPQITPRINLTGSTAGALITDSLTTPFINCPPLSVIAHRR
ncbi:hypothetical protein CDAR_95771 [Caerostris darwini]|uniref:Uncharacterized protein n=1 Tax=Caerostris darwini TaxID=1538125 RepID=A0AAV4UPU0_9ARAC|nr:hypothetical protein CDAR_95771 [Caerostris darwini]